MKLRPFLSALLLPIFLFGCGGSNGGKPGLVPPAQSQKFSQEFVTVSSGVRLEMLDFGGTGSVLLLLAGAGDTAHVYEDFALRFTDQFHVVALTRRGYGQSSQPNTGYDTLSLAQDIRAVLDAKAWASVNVMGHSIAGDEMTRLAGDFPTRINKLVYLDAAYDRTKTAPVFKAIQFPEPPAPSASDLSSVDGYSAYLNRIYGVVFPVAEVKQSTKFSANGAVQAAVTPPTISAMHIAGVESPNYAKIKAPALGIYSVAVKPSDLIPWFLPSNPDWTAAQGILDSEITPMMKQERDKFAQQVVGSKVIAIEAANHYVFLSHADKVAQEARNFLLAK